MNANCPHCGKPLPEAALGGLCPECMLKVGTATATAEVPGEGQPPPTTPPQPALDPAEIARRFPQLEILECLGRGGMGVVYKARQPALDRLVALKVLAPEKGTDPRFATRFTREAQALARLNHPNIVTVYDFGESNGLFYLLMEFVDGVSLRQLLERREIAPETALAIVPHICVALQYAHEQGIVHRDIKPENVLLDKAGRVKIADFGIAKMLGQESVRPALTEERQVIGTPHYMAPEQVEKPLLVDHRADIYSLGVVFYEMLTGELPLGRFAPPSRKVQIDVRLDQVVLHALEKEPELRYQQASQVKTDVERIAADGAAAAPSKSPSATPVSQPERTPVAGTDSRRQAALWYGFIVSLLGVPIGVILHAPVVWLLGLAGIAVSAAKLGFLSRISTWTRGPGSAAGGIAGTNPGQQGGEFIPGSSLTRQSALVPRVLRMPIGLLLLAGLGKAVGSPRDPLASVALLGLAAGLFYRSKLAYALSLFFCGIQVLAMATAGSPFAVLGSLFLNALVAVPLLLCLDWYFPRDAVTGARLRSDEFAASVLLVPPLLFLLFLRGGHALMHVSLDPDELFFVGVFGLPLSVAAGALLLVAARAFLPAPLPAPAAPVGADQRWSGWTIAALVLLILSLPFGGGLSAMFRLLAFEPGWNPSSNEALLTFLGGGLAVAAILGTMVLGSEALRRMRLDPARSRGRVGAVVSAWFWPCMLAGALLTPVRVSTASHRAEASRQMERLQRESEAAAAAASWAPVNAVNPGDPPRVLVRPADEPMPPTTWDAPDERGAGSPASDSPGTTVIHVDADGTVGGLQIAIDAAPPGAVIRVGPGRYEEKLHITKPLVLEGAGWSRTVIGPAAPWTPPDDAEATALQERLRATTDSSAQQEIRAQLEALGPQPVVRVTEASKVQLRGLRIIFPGIAPEGRLASSASVELLKSDVAIADCAIVGSPGSGLLVRDGSHLSVSNSLVAAAWNTGIVLPRDSSASALTVIDSDIRNCHYAGITLGRGQNEVRIERCRISGAAWHGIRYDDSTPAISGCLIFGNARSGIYASGRTGAQVSGNVFWKNEMNGMSCWYQNRDRIQHNLFAENRREGLALLGASEPVLERNVFVGQPQAVLIGPISGQGESSLVRGKLHLAGNVFWRNEVNLAVPTGKQTEAQPLMAALPLTSFPGNREEDPGYVSLATGDFARTMGDAGTLPDAGPHDPLTTASPWPLQAEELAIIPDGETRDSRAWKRDR